MNYQEEPLISVLTPVYNGEQYIAECIESVLGQTYQNWEYVIVNNNSTDGTLPVAERYASLDKRIRIHNNDQLLDVIANHNRAFKLASPFSKYCKVLSADDWLFPECLARMVSLAEANPSVGVVGSYQVSGGGDNWRNWSVKWTELPIAHTSFSLGSVSSVFSGREICRSHLLGGPYVFGTPTSILYRADLVRKRERFYPNSSAEADTSACYQALQESDFGFVHQILSYERDMHVRTTTRSRSLNAYIPSKLSDLQEYGAIFLSNYECEHRSRQLLGEYYRYLAGSALRFRSRDFWAYHRRRLNELGYRFSYVNLAKATLARMISLMWDPKGTGQRALRGIAEQSLNTGQIPNKIRWRQR